MHVARAVRGLGGGKGGGSGGGSGAAAAGTLFSGVSSPRGFGSELLIFPRPI